jgi:hypothetical protein
MSRAAARRRRAAHHPFSRACWQDSGKFKHRRFCPGRQAFFQKKFAPQEVWATFNVLTKPDGTRPRHAPMVLRHTAITRVLHDDYKAVALIYQNNGLGEMEASHPYWQYRHGVSRVPRPERPARP